MKKFILIISVCAMSAGLSACMKFEKIDYDKSGAPVIKVLPKQKMVLAGSRGTPEKIAEDCIGSLYRVFFSMKYRNKLMAAPRARWPVAPETQQGEWVGIFGLPVPENVNDLPVLKKKFPVEVRLGYWEYGETAEILHAGSYDSETATIDRLKKFIAEKGYVISGPHEEVYIKGPGMFGKGNPEKYLTLIRYNVKKAVKGK